jgi:transcriptional regulator with XRE-family HTH domain
MFLIETTAALLKHVYLHLNIRYLRQENNFNQIQLGNMLGVSSAMISAYEKGKNTPSTEVLFTLSELFKVTLDSLVFDDLSQTLGEIRAEEPISVYTESGEDQKEDLPASSLLRLVMRLETELYELKERLKKEAPDLAREWGIK